MYVASLRSVDTDSRLRSKFTDNVTKFSSITNPKQLIEILFHRFFGCNNSYVFFREIVIKMFLINSHLAKQLIR